MKPPREIAHSESGRCGVPLLDDSSSHAWHCTSDTYMVRAGMIEALRWVLPHVFADMRAEVIAMLAELEGAE
jgi:hypothetical protein